MNSMNATLPTTSQHYENFNTDDKNKVIVKTNKFVEQNFRKTIDIYHCHYRILARKVKGLLIFLLIIGVAAAVVVPSVLLTRKKNSSSSLSTTNLESTASPNTVYTTTSVTVATNTTANQTIVIPNILENATWAQNGVTVAGGNGQGSASNQLDRPFGLDIDYDQTVLIADCYNHRIMQWKKDDTHGQVVAGGKGQGNRLDQLFCPTDVLIDKATDSLIIADQGNRRVIRLSRRNDTTQSEILIDNIECFGLTLDDQRYLYVSDTNKHEIRRYKLGDKNGTVVAGGNSAGGGLNQFSNPRYFCVDPQQNVYASDHSNNRIMKWSKGAKEGIVVAGGKGQGSTLTQLYYPHGILVDNLDNFYIGDYGNNRVLRWSQGSTHGTVIAGGNGPGAGANQFSGPLDLSFDRHGNIYIVDHWNSRVQRFSVQYTT